MGTEITLKVAGVSVTYSKNHRGIDHGSIFQEQDRKAIKSDQLDYDWYEKEGEVAAQAQSGPLMKRENPTPGTDFSGLSAQ